MGGVAYIIRIFGDFEALSADAIIFSKIFVDVLNKRTYIKRFIFRPMLIIKIALPFFAFILDKRGKILTADAFGAESHRFGIII